MAKTHTVKAPAEAKTGKAEPAGKNAGKKKKARGRVFIDENRCKGCGLCIAFCPTGVLEFSDRFNKKGYHPPEVRLPDSCTGCDLCGLYCPDFAIHSVRIAAKQKDKKAKDE